MEQLPANVPAIKSNSYISVDAWDSFTKKEEFYQKILQSSTENIIYLGHNEWDYYTSQAFPRFGAVLDFLKKSNRILHTTTASYPHDGEPKHPNLKVYYWIDWYFRKTFNRCIYASKDYEGSNFNQFSYYKQSLNNSNFEYYITSLNYRSHRHRCHMIDLLAKNDLIEGNAIGWHHLTEIHGSNASMYEWKYFTPQKLSFDDNFNEDWTFPPKKYFNAFAQIISESSPVVPIFSEKTVMGIICHKPFLIAGPYGMHKKLKDLNFEIYDEIFDYAFDDVVDEGIRYQMIMDNFVRLQKENTLTDLIKLQEKIKSKLIHNFENLKKIVFDMSSVPPIIRKIYNIYTLDGIDYDHWSNSILSSIDGHRRDFYK